MAPTKKQRLEAHNMLGSCSTANLERIISRLVPNHEMHAESRRHIDRGLLEELGGLTESVMLATTDGDWEWTFLNPSRLIQHLVGSCPDLGAVYRRAANLRLPTLEHPWNMLVCFDEFAPGHQFKCDNSKKVMVLNFNFVELGEEVLSKDCSWMTPIVVRTTRMKIVIGHWSYMLRIFFRMLICGNQGGLTVGVTVMADGMPLTIFFKIAALGSDYDGIRIGWDWKGARGLRMCLRCYCFAKNSGLAHRVPNGVEANCTDKTKFIERDNQDFEDDVDLVNDAGRSYANGTIALLCENSFVSGEPLS